MEDADTFINTYFDAVQKLMIFEITIVNYRSIGEHLKVFLEISPLLNQATKELTGLVFLNDSELTDKSKKLNLLFREENDNATKLIKTIEEKESFDSIPVLDRVKRFYSDANKLITQMKARLDELAQILP